MHVIALVLFVWFVQTAGDNRPVAVQALTKPGLTLEECQAAGQAFVAQIRQQDGVSGAEFKCVDQVQKASIRWKR